MTKCSVKHPCVTIYSVEPPQVLKEACKDDEIPAAPADASWPEDGDGVGGPAEEKAVEAA